MANDRISALVAKYMNAKESDKSIYLDAHEFDSLADYFDENDDLEEARDVIEAGLLIHPKNSSLLVKKAKFAIYDGDYLKALALLKENASYDLDIALMKIECFLNLGLTLEASVISQEIMASEDEDDLDTTCAELGFVYLETDYYKEAVLFFEKSLTINADNMEVLTDLTYAYEMIGEYEKAVETSNKALDIDPYHYDVWVNLGRLYSMKEEYEKAVDAFDFALTIRSEDTIVQKLKGHCLSLCNRVEEAIEVFEAIVEENPDEASVYFLLTECYQSLGNYDKALELLDKYEAPAESIGLEYIAKKIQILLQCERVAEAEELIKNEISKGENLVELHVVAAEIMLHQDRWEDAVASLMQVFDENQDDYHLLNMLSVLYIKREDYINAIKYTELMADVDPTSTEIKERLALLYFEINDEELFNEVLEEFTDSELIQLFAYIYNPIKEDDFNRDDLIMILNDARERRMLFKNIQY